VCTRTHGVRIALLVVVLSFFERWEERKKSQSMVFCDDVDEYEYEYDDN
jgi:hypothetical protein